MTKIPKPISLPRSQILDEDSPYLTEKAAVAVGDLYCEAWCLVVENHRTQMADVVYDYDDETVKIHLYPKEYAGQQPQDAHIEYLAGGLTSDDIFDPDTVDETSDGYLVYEVRDDFHPRHAKPLRAKDREALGITKEEAKQYYRIAPIDAFTAGGYLTDDWYEEQREDASERLRQIVGLGREEVEP